jgi:hypothetical protein
MTNDVQGGGAEVPALATQIEADLVRLADGLTAPAARECLRCYLLRLIAEFGCDGSYRWTLRWMQGHGARPASQLRQLERRGGFCDCEIVMNAFPEYPPVPGPLPCAGVSRPGSLRPCDLSRFAKSA